jgi:hypothetical protein
VLCVRRGSLISQSSHRLGMTSYKIHSPGFRPIIHDSSSTIHPSILFEPTTPIPSLRMPQSNNASPSYYQEVAANGQQPQDANEPSSPVLSSKSTGEKPSSDTPRQVTRKGRACMTCRKLKVKCGGPESGDGFGCQRCQRLGLECKMVKRLRVSVADEGYVYITLGRAPELWPSSPFSKCLVTELTIGQTNGSIHVPA